MSKHKVKSKSERKNTLADKQKKSYDSRNQGAGGKGVLNLQDYPDVKFFEPAKGKNKIDIIPYVVATNQHPDGSKKGDLHYVLNIWVHFRVGPTEAAVVCLAKTFNRPCPICEEMSALMKSGDEDAKALKPKRRSIYNIIDRDNKKAGIQLFSTSHFLFEKEVLEESQSDDEGVIIFSDLEEGKSIKFRATEEKAEGGKPFIKFKSFSFADREPYDADILENSVPLDKVLTVPSYDEVRALHIGVEASLGDDDDDDDDDNNSKRKTKKPSKKKPHREEDDDDDEDDDEEDDDEEEDDEEDDDDEDEEDDEDVCPSGHKYGKDHDKHDDCYECSKWDVCKKFGRSLRKKS